jgi:putative ABC transport system permease protein
LALAAIGKLLQLLAQWLVQNGSSFVARQALRNLQRKGNFLQILFMVMGGSAYLLVVLLSLQSSLLAQLNALQDENQLNLLLLDIAPKQHPQLLKLLKKQVPPEAWNSIETFPVVQSRLQQVKGMSLGNYRKFTSKPPPDWALYHDHLVAWRSELFPSEAVTRGSDKPQPGQLIIHKRLAEALELLPGDSLLMNTGSQLWHTQVSGIRTSDWQKLLTNLPFVSGLPLPDSLPHMYLLAMQLQQPQLRQQLQQQLSEQFPGIYIIDTGQLTAEIAQLVGYAALSVQALSGFALLAGLLILAASVQNTQRLRQQEYRLFQALGAARKLLLQLNLAEFGWLGLLAVLSGVLPGLLTAWVVNRYLWEISFRLDLPLLLAVLLLLVLLLSASGWLLTYQIQKEGPQKVLR